MLGGGPARPHSALHFSSCPSAWLPSLLSGCGGTEEEVWQQRVLKCVGAWGLLLCTAGRKDLGGAQRQHPGMGAQPGAPRRLDAPGLSPRVKCVPVRSLLWPAEWCLPLALASHSVLITRIRFAPASTCLPSVQSGIIGVSAGGGGVWPASLGAAETCNLTALGFWGHHNK